MRIYLNVKFEEKEAVKKLALIRWDATNKKWYFEGESLPTCLETYRLPPTYGVPIHRFMRRRQPTE